MWAEFRKFSRVGGPVIWESLDVRNQRCLVFPFVCVREETFFEKPGLLSQMQWSQALGACLRGRLPCDARLGCFWTVVVRKRNSDFS